MSDSTSANDIIARLRKEADLYETQGLYSQAIQIYKKILVADPKNLDARERMAELRSARRERGGTDSFAASTDDFSPRLALDLGLAYMGMNLYSEAILEFQKGLGLGPVHRTELLRQSITCLIHLEKIEEACAILDELIAEPALDKAQKGDIIADAVAVLDQVGRQEDARKLFDRFPKAQTAGIPNFARIFARVQPSRKAPAQQVKAQVPTPAKSEPRDKQPARGPEPASTPAQEPAAEGPEPIPETEEFRLEVPKKTASAPPEAGKPTQRKRDRGRPASPDDTLDLGEEERPRLVHFACHCGERYSAPRASIGRKKSCRCGRELVIPAADPRSDRLTEMMVGRVLGGTRILYKLGGGGMGGVFKGHHIGLDLPVAVKILHEHLADRDSVFIKRFIREARAAAKLQHPNIVGVLNVGYEEGIHYLVMPFIAGGSAADRIKERHRLPFMEALDIAIQITDALRAAEESNILHRDVKPANILFTEKGEAKLADLGLAKSYQDTDSAITQTGIACGTPLYFSPEQAKGLQNLDIRSDIYSLGITLYHLIEGRPPFTAESAYVIFQKHVHEELPPFRDASPPPPDLVVKLLKKMTAKKREDRFFSAQDLMDTLIAVKEQLSGSGKPAPKRGILERLGITR
jgi:hypothetical protein